MATLTNQISDLREQRKRTDILREQDNLEALIELGALEPKVPDGLGAFVRTMISAVFKLVGIVIWLGMLVIFVNFLVLMYQLLLALPLVVARIWISASAIWSLLLLRNFPDLQKPLNFNTLGPNADDVLPWLMRALIFPGQVICWLLVLLVLFVAVAAFWSVVWVGVQFVWNWVLENGQTPLTLTPLQVNYAVSALVIAAVTWALYKKQGGFWLFLLWSGGVAALIWQYTRNPIWFELNSLTDIQAVLRGNLNLTPTRYLAVAQLAMIGLSLVLPLGIAIWFANGFRGLWLRWQNRITWMVQTWRLRARLRSALSLHRKRNHRNVAGDGNRAVCKEHLAKFVSKNSGSVSYFCCPVCKSNADANAYTQVQSIEGWLDRNMSDPHDQLQGALRQNMYEWIAGNLPNLLPMQLVVINKLDDSHDAEQFRLRYLELQQKNKQYGPVRVKVLSTDLDDNTRRLLEKGLGNK